MPIKSNAEEIDVWDLVDDDTKGQVPSALHLSNWLMLFYFSAVGTVKVPVAVATGRSISASQAVARTNATVLVT